MANLATTHLYKVSILLNKLFLAYLCITIMRAIYVLQEVLLCNFFMFIRVPGMFYLLLTQSF